MSEHWNIQVKIQKVTTSPTNKDSRSINAALTGREREVTEVVSLAVSAPTEAEAYEKVHRVLTANHPDLIVVRPGETEEQTRRRPIRDNPQA